MEITLADLLIMEPRLRVGVPASGDVRELSRREDTAVSWAVTARTTLPHLPPLRGGELLLLPERAIAAVDDDLGALLREGRARGASGVVTPGSVFRTTRSLSHDLCVLEWDGVLTPEAETDINRQLTACRGDLYRVGTELERRMADVAATGAGLGPLARMVSETTGLLMSVVDAEGRQLTGPGPDQGGGAALASGKGAHAGADAARSELHRGAALLLTPRRPEQRVLARFLVARVAEAAKAALQRDDAARPRGSRRAEATAFLLAGSGGIASDQRSQALALGLDPDAVYFVAATDLDNATELGRALALLGSVHPAGGRNGHQMSLVATTPRVPSETLAGRVRDVAARWDRSVTTAQHSLALSGAAFGVASLPRAAREAEFVAAMQSVGEAPRRAAAFGSVGDLGAIGLLYHLRDAPELRGFIAEALGGLPAKDQRGTLRATLRTFLESGGSQVDASQRLGIHRNTLSYRLRRIGELVGRDVADPTAWLTLHLAIRASDMLEVIPEER